MPVAHNQNLQHYIWAERPLWVFSWCRSGVGWVEGGGGRTKAQSGSTGSAQKQKSAAGQWDGKHKRINPLSLSGAQSRRSLLENGVQLRAAVCHHACAAGLGTRYAPGAAAQTPAVLNMVCLMLPFSVLGVQWRVT